VCSKANAAARGRSRRRHDGPSPRTRCSGTARPHPEATAVCHREVQSRSPRRAAGKVVSHERYQGLGAHRATGAGHHCVHRAIPGAAGLDAGSGAAPSRADDGRFPGLVPELLPRRAPSPSHWPGRGGHPGAARRGTARAARSSCGGADAGGVRGMVRLRPPDHRQERDGRSAWATTAIATGQGASTPGGERPADLQGRCPRPGPAARRSRW